MIKLDTESKSYTELTAWAEDVVKFAKINIGDKNRKRKDPKTGKIKRRKIDASGNLRRSIKYKLSTNKNSINFGVSGASYADVVESGRRKGKFIPLDPLVKWIRKKPVRLRSEDNKFIKMTDSNVRQFARNISKKAQKYGTSPTHFLRDAVEMAESKHRELFREAVEEDVRTQVTILVKNLERLGIKRQL